jgi:hypothetical protein
MASLLLVVTAQTALARGINCKDDPELVGPCFQLHGKLFVANGTPSARILRLGTKRILGVSEYHKSYMPDALEGRLTWDDIVYGDYVLCPFSHEEPGKMQFVCIQSGSRVLLERRVEGKLTLTRLPDVDGP